MAVSTRRKPGRANTQKTQRRSSATQSSTVRIPTPLIDQVRPFLLKGSARSVNEFVADSVAQRLRELRDAEIDQAFAAMSDDADYQAESIKVSKEFEASDWHSLQRSEGRR